MRLVLVASLGLLCTFGAAFAAGPFDGVWHGTVEPSSGRCPQGAVAMRITDADIVGRFSIGGSQVPFRGTVTADGTVNAAYNYPEYSASGTLTGKIAGGDFTGKFDSSYAGANASCIRNVTAKRD